VPTITRPRLLEDIQAQLALEAERSHLGLLVSYPPLTRTQLAAHIADITTSLEPLTDGDTATFEGIDGEPVRFNPRLRVNEEELNDLLATRTISNVSELILKVKKPDFLGSSMWEFHFDGHAILAGILDETWLQRFRKDGLGVRPGVALRVRVKWEVSYNDEHDALPPKYSILVVHEVIPPPGEQGEQLMLPSPPGAPPASGNEHKTRA
jgi:hypothetical protein